MELVSELWGSMAITGKTVVLVLIALSIYSYVVMVERFTALRTNGQRSGEFAAQLGEGGDAGQILSAARVANEVGQNSLASVVEVGLQEFESLQSDGQPEAIVVEGVDEAVSRQLDVAIINLRARLSGMATISGVAPFLGLFGTVTGLIAALLAQNKTPFEAAYLGVHFSLLPYLFLFISRLKTTRCVVYVKDFSAGESEIVAFSLLWAVNISSNKYYPIVTDSPFNRLDSDHRLNFIKRNFLSTPLM